MIGIDIQEVYVKKLVIPVRLDLTLNPGDDLLVTGDNGSGKTMCFKALAGFVNYSGKVAVNGETDPEEYRKELGLYIEDYFDPSMTTRRCLELAKEVKGRDQLDEARTQAMIDGLNFGPQLKKKYGALSKGNKKKLHLIVAFLGHPLGVVLDEPFANIDENAATFLQDWLAQYLSNGGILLYNNPVDLPFLSPKFRHHISNQ